MKKNTKERLFEVMARLDSTFKPKLNESTDQDRYEDVVFMQGDDAHKALTILDVGGEDAALNYLKQWHEPGSHMGSSKLGHGSDDKTYEKDGYIMSWNPRMGYIGLQYELSHMNENESVTGDEGDGYGDDLYENVLNEDRAAYTNLLQMFQENNLRPGSFIALGYVNAVDIPKRIFPTNANEEYANKLINAADEFGLSELEIKLLKEFISDEIWQKTKAGEILLKSKKAPKNYFEWDNRFAGIIQFNRYVLNYMDRQSLAKNFQKQRDSEIELRRKYGFGKDDDQYPEDDWRRKVGSTGRPKYRGVGIEPAIDPRDANKGSTYKDKFGDIPVYGDIDKEGNPRINPQTGYQRMTLRQNISSNLKRLNTNYFLVDEEGNLNPISYKFVNFFKKYVKQVRDGVVDELQDDEKQFVEELKNIKSQYFTTQFISDRIAYITATVEDDKTKEKKPIYFYNDKLDVLEQFPVNTQQLQNHINQYMKDSFKTAKELAGSDAPLGENKINLSEKRFEPETFYNTQSEAVDAAVQKAESMGYEVDKDDIWRYFGEGWVGYENYRRGIITLYKNGMEQRKGLVISLYRMPSGKYELTTYIN